MIRRPPDQKKDYRLFLIAILCGSFACALVDAVFNNFLNDRFAISSLQRTVLELPRETPGLIVMFVSALFFFACNRRLAMISQFIAAAGALLIGIASTGYTVMLAWLFIFSLGQHMFMPLHSAIGMELAKGGKTGKMLGQFQGAGNFAAIAGSFAVFLGFKYLGLSHSATFVGAAACFVLAGFILWGMEKGKPLPTSTRFRFRKEYRLFYILNVLHGTRKQIFITFAPWILVTVYNQPTQALATLFAIGGVIGIFFKPMLGRAIDRYGERAILAGEAIILVFVCLGYGYAKKFFPFDTALMIASTCFVVDQLLFSVGMARATYLKKIAVNPSEVTATLTTGVSIDHIFSITIALVGGFIWQSVGYEYFFVLGACIALTNLYFALKVRT